MIRLFRQFWVDVRGMKHYWIAATLVFAASAVIGAMNQEPAGIIKDSLDGLGGIVEKIEASSHPKLFLFFFIFFNNAIKSIFFVFFGAFLGIVPLFVLIVNGMLLGYVVMHPAQDLSPWVLIFKGIMPHGIIELPAIILACAYGIRFGGLLVKSLFLLFTEEKRAKAGQEIMHFLWMTLPLMIVLTVSLFVAGVIESTITYSLMR